MKSHDALWKGLLQTFFPEFLELVVPAIAERLETRDSRFLEQEAFTDPPDGQKALLDLVAEVPSRDGPNKVVLVHVEVERAFGAVMDRRMWRYFFQLSLKYDYPIVPIVLFLKGGEAGVTRRRVEHKVAGLRINQFTYWSVGLSGYPALPLLEQGPLGIALASCARGDRLPKDRQKYLCMEALLDHRTDDATTQLLITAIETYLALNKEQTMKYAEHMAQSARTTELQEIELTWAGKLHETGVELGRREGRVDAHRSTLGLILEQRFGRLPSKLLRRLQRLDDPARLEALIEQALKAKSQDEVEELLG